MIRRVVRTRKYMKALASFPRKVQDAVETSVDALEGD